MRILAMTALLAWSALALAADPACPTTLPQEQLNQCYKDAAADTDKRLDDLLAELRESVGRKNWAYLKQSQVFWEKSRAMDCRVEASFIDGPIRTAVAAGCTEKRARSRMHQLRYLLCPRYDLDGHCDAAKRYE